MTRPCPNGPEPRPAKARVRPFSELRDTGLLWLINTSVFHPRGYALALEFSADHEAIGWNLTGDGSEPWSFQPGPDVDDCMRRAAASLLPDLAQLAPYRPVNVEPKHADLEPSPPTATCHDDGEPLVMTFEFPGYEFVCIVCERKYEYLQPKAAVATAALTARHEELKAQYDEARAARTGRAER